MSSNYSKYHSDMEAIMLYIIGFIVIFLIISGNFLVIIAVVKDKTLKNFQNWFIGKMNKPLKEFLEAAQLQLLKHLHLSRFPP